MTKVTCKKCGKSWETEIEMKFCPFCGAKIEKEKPKHIEDMESLLITIRDDYGMEVFKNGKQTVALMRDLSPKLTQEIKLYQIVAKSNLFIKYEEAFQLTNEKRELKLTEIEQELESDYFLGKQHINTLKKWHMYLFDVEESNEIPVTAVDNKKEDPVTSVTDSSVAIEVPLDNAKIGDIISFGKYKNEPIVWRILDEKKGKILVISEYILDVIPYDKKYVGWYQSNLRKWLKFVFFEEAFTKSEQKKINYYTNENVFVLSINEVNKYFKSNTERLAKGTQYARSRLFYEEKKKEYMRWWLKESVDERDANFIGLDGEIKTCYFLGLSKMNEKVGVRPAMWIRIKRIWIKR